LQRKAAVPSIYDERPIRRLARFLPSEWAGATIHAQARGTRAAGAGLAITTIEEALRSGSSHHGQTLFRVN
jgi:hypothetical protein